MKPEEVVILLIVASIWIYACWIFYARYGKGCKKIIDNFCRIIREGVIPDPLFKLDFQLARIAWTSTQRERKYHLKSPEQKRDVKQNFWRELIVALKYDWLLQAGCRNIWE